MRARRALVHLSGHAGACMNGSGVRRRGHDTPRLCVRSCSRAAAPAPAHSCRHACANVRAHPHAHCTTWRASCAARRGWTPSAVQLGVRGASAASGRADCPGGASRISSRSSSPRSSPRPAAGRAAPTSTSSLRLSAEQPELGRGLPAAVHAGMPAAAASTAAVPAVPRGAPARTRSPRRALHLQSQLACLRRPPLQRRRS